MSEPNFQPNPEPVTPYPEEVIARATGITFGDDTILRLSNAIAARISRPLISGRFPKHIIDVLAENGGFLWRTALPLYQGNTIIVDFYINGGTLVVEFQDKDGDRFWTGRFES
jgi:hypothetical protein